MTPIDAFILGIVEGATEFIPVSSTGHLILASSLLHVVQTDFVKSFEIIIQLGAILAVVALYWRSFFNIELLKKITVAFIPTGVIGLTLYHIVKVYLIGNEYVVLFSLLVGGIILIAFEWFHHDSSEEIQPEHISYRQALMIGLFQSVALVPGVSRSAASIIGGLSLGLPRKVTVQFAFLLAVPTMLAATGLDVLQNYKSFTSGNSLALGIGFITAFVVALASIHWLLGYVRRHTFTAFGIYRVALSLIFFAFLLM